jgi:hypothetical protein
VVHNEQQFKTATPAWLNGMIQNNIMEESKVDIEGWSVPPLQHLATGNILRKDYTKYK